MSIFWNPSLDVAVTCNSKKCNKPIKKNEKVIKCTGQCRNIFHCACVKLNDTATELINENENLCFRCDDCIIFESMIKGSLAEISAKFTSMLSKMMSQHTEMKTHFNERIMVIENTLHNSGKTVLNEMTKVVGDYAKKVEEKSLLFESSVLNNDNDNDDHNVSAWSNVGKKMKKKPAKEKVIVITPRNDQSRIELKKSLRKSIDTSKINVCGVSNVAKNGIAVKCNDDEACDVLMNKVADALGDEVEVKKPKNVTPRIKLLKVNDPEDDNIQFVQQLKQHNQFLSGANIEVIHREQVKAKGKILNGVFNIVMQVERTAYDEIMTVKKLKHHFEVYRVVDNIYIRRCYNCCGFNHFSKAMNGNPACQNQKACSKCAGAHSHTQCAANFEKCVNCLKSNDRSGTTYDVNHNVWSRDCSVYKIKLERSKRGLTHIQ